MVLCEELLFPVRHVLGSLLESLLAELCLIFLPFRVKLAVKLELWVLVMMLELLPHVNIANGSHLGRQDSSVELQNAVIQPQAVFEHLLQLFLHC